MCYLFTITLHALRFLSYVYGNINSAKPWYSVIDEQQLGHSTEHLPDSTGQIKLGSPQTGHMATNPIREWIQHVNIILLYLTI